MNRLRMSQTVVEEKNPQIKLTHEFKEIMECRRHDLPNFLKEHGSYEQLKEILTQLEGQNLPIRNTVSRMLLGNAGYHSNAQLAVYELPTKELLEVICDLCHQLQITKLQEMAAGQGLVSRMLKEKLDDTVEILASDGNCWLETSGGIRYLPITEKTFLDDLLTASSTSTGEDFLISWIPHNVLVNQNPDPSSPEFYELNSWVEHRKPRSMMIIGDYLPGNSFSFGLTIRMQRLGYQMITYPLKQISYRDYFHLNKKYPMDSSRSVLTLFYLPDTLTEEQRKQIQLEEVMKRHTDAFHNLVTEPTTEQLIQDLMIDEALPFRLHDKMDSDPEMMKLVSTILQEAAMIPDYLESKNELQFWWRRAQIKQYPLMISERESFLQYYGLIQQLESKGYEAMIYGGYLPSWVTDNVTAEQVIWTDYSTKSYDKAWKENLTTFQSRFGQLFVPPPQSQSQLQHQPFGDNSLANLVNTLFGVQ